MTRRLWDPLEVEIIRRLYPHVPTAKLAESMGRSARQIYAKARNLGIRKSVAYLAGHHACRLRRGDRIGATTQFRPGHVTWNKGMKGLDIGGKHTRFKQGQRRGRANQNYKPIGHLRINADGYLQRKARDDGPTNRRWEMEHHRVWQDAGREIPPGHILTFRDGNPRNVAIDNLELISRAENMRRNSVHNLPAPLPQIIQLQGALRRQIKQRQGNIQQHE